MKNRVKSIAVMLDHIPLFIFVLDENGDVVYYNEALKKQIREIPETEVDLLKIIKTKIKRSIEAHEPVLPTFEINCAILGQTFIYSMSRILEEIEHLDGYIGIIRNVTDFKIIEKKLTVFSELIEQAPISIVITDKDGNIEYVNAFLEKTSGYKARELIGKNPRVFKSGLNMDVIYKELWSAISSGDVWNGRLVNKKKSGDLYVERIIISPLKNGDGKIVNYIGFKDDITERVKLEEKVMFDESHDTLTSLFNRTEFELRVFYIINEARKYLKKSHVALINIDDFRVINDVIGYDVGNELLKDFAIFIESELPKGVIIARMGSDEFGMLFINETNYDVIKICETLREAIVNWKFIWKESSFRITISIGIAEITETSPSVSSVLTSADFACNEAKKTGKNRIQVYNQNSPAFIKRKEQQEMFLKLKAKLEKDELFLLFQRISPLDPLGKLHYETLIRMREGDDLLSPYLFLEVAENFQIVFDVDMWVIKQVFRYLTAIRKFRVIDFVITINLSSKTVSDIRCIDAIKTLIRDFNIDPKTIGFEITETAAITNFEIAQKLIFELRGLGCIILLDDFGSGMSSFTRFQNILIDIVKIDGSLIKSIDTSVFDRSLVKGIVGIIKTIGAKSVAEFVHSQSVYETAKELGIDYFQGFYIHKPAPICTVVCDKPSCIDEQGVFNLVKIEDCERRKSFLSMIEYKNEHENTKEDPIERGDIAPMC